MATSITAPPFSGESEFSKEITPPFGTAGDWGSEKTILVMDPVEQAHAAWLRNVDTGEWHSLDDFPLTIGRHPDCDLRINDGSLSRRHASIIRLDDGGFVIEDCGSTNGVKVNDCKVDRVILATGDEFSLGSAGFTFHLHGPDGASAVPATPLRSEEGNSFQTLKVGVASLWLHGVAKLKRFTQRETTSGRTGFAGAKQWAQDHPTTTAVIGALLVLLSAALLYNGLVLERVTPVTTPVVDGSIPEKSSVPPEPEGAKSPGGTKDGTGAPTPGADTEPEVIDLGEVEVRAPAAGTSETKALEGTPGAETPVVATPPVPRVAANPAPPKQRKTKLVSAEQSEKDIADSLALYAGGNAPDALSRLDVLSGSKAHRRQYREQAAELRVSLAAAYSDYENGKQAMEGGDKNQAFASWEEFLSKERALLDGRKSVYARDINDAVALEYTDQGNQAEIEERWQDAHRLWGQAARLQPAGAASASIVRLQTRAKEHYLEGYRSESANINKAREHWLKAVTLAGPGTEYSTKARAKLRWYGIGGTDTGSEQ